MILVPHGNFYNDTRTVRMQPPIFCSPIDHSCGSENVYSGQVRVIELFASSTQLSVKLLIKKNNKKSLKIMTFLDVKLSDVAFILLINAKMPTLSWHFNIYEQDRVRAQLN